MAKDKKKAASDDGAPAADHKYEAGYVPRMQKMYADKVVTALKEQFKYKNAMQVPRLQKVVLNVGLGEAVANPKLVDSCVEDLRSITGQQPIIRRARKSIASFKLREGLAIGVKVTLRRNKMWEFTDRLFNIALPRVRDFKGINPKGFDGQGNFTMGVKEQIIFPEIDYDKVDSVRGMNITFVTTAPTNEEGRVLLEQLGLPFRGKKTQA
jgi:large subunit ribosomal protein L5